MKKLIAVLAALLVLTCGTTVLAAPSVTAADLAEGVKATAAGEEITVVAVSEEQVAAATAAALAENENSDVIALFTPQARVGAGRMAITFDVPDVKAGEKIYILRLAADGSTWEVFHPTKVEAGKVTANLVPSSPVAIVRIPATATLPKTGASLVLPVAALICAAGAVGCTRKVKFN